MLIDYKFLYNQQKKYYLKKKGGTNNSQLQEQQKFSEEFNEIYNQFISNRNFIVSDKTLERFKKNILIKYLFNIIYNYLFNNDYSDLFTYVKFGILTNKCNFLIYYSFTHKKFLEITKTPVIIIDKLYKFIEYVLRRNENLKLNEKNQYTKKQLEEHVSNMLQLSLEQNQKVKYEQSLLHVELKEARKQYGEDQKCLESAKSATRMLQEIDMLNIPYNRLQDNYHFESDKKPNTEKNILSDIQDSLDMQEFINKSTKSKNTDTDLDSYQELNSFDFDFLDDLDDLDEQDEVKRKSNDENEEMIINKKQKTENGEDKFTNKDN